MGGESVGCRAIDVLEMILMLLTHANGEYISGLSCCHHVLHQRRHNTPLYPPPLPLSPPPLTLVLAPLLPFLLILPSFLTFQLFFLLALPTLLLLSFFTFLLSLFFYLCLSFISPFTPRFASSFILIVFLLVSLHFFHSI